MGYAALVEHLLTSLRRRRLVFVQLSPMIGRLLASSDCTDHFQVTAVEALATSRAGQALILVPGFEAVLESEDPVRGLGQVREVINDLLDADRSVCMVSRAPRMAFPDCPGSSILEDAHVFHADSAPGGPWHDWTEEDDHEVLLECLRWLGPDALACLDYLVFDLQLSGGLSAGLISPLELEAIRGAGLVAVDGAAARLELRLPMHRLMPALTQSISDHLGVQPDFPVVSDGLVEIERRIRRSVQRRAVEVFGEKWRGRVLSPEIAERVADRATQELSRGASVKGLRSPFEWLTLGELVDLVRTAAWVDRLGRDDRYWQRFGAEIMPIRNRTSHMRFLRHEDRPRVEYWKASLARTLG
jgi:hypothetical protein